MHERSLVKSLIEQVLKEGRLRGWSRLHEIHIEIGEFSGVEASLVEIAFAEMSSDAWSHPVSLKLDVVPLTAVCSSCNTSFPVEGFRFECPRCASRQVHITAGEEMRLVSVRAECASAFAGTMK